MLSTALKAPHYRLFLSYRMLITALFFGIAFLGSANFSSMNFTIACMVNATADLQAIIIDRAVCSSNESSTSLSEGGYNGHLLWSRREQSIVLAGSAIGGLSVVFIGGFFTDKYGARPVGLLASFLFTISALIMPISTIAGWKVVTVVRLAQGMGAIAGWPLFLAVASEWFPIEERGMLTSIGASGIQIETHTDKCQKLRSNVQTPWSQIARSPVIWSLMLVAFGAYYSCYFIASFMPTYYKEYLGIDVSKSGLLSSLPSLVQFIARISAGPIGDKMDNSIGRTKTIKIMTAIAGYGTCVMLIASTAFDCHRPYGVVVCLSGAYFFFGYAIAGFLRAPMLISPGFAGIISGMFQTSNFIAAIVTPYISGAVIGNGSATQWHLSFYIAAIFSAIGTTAFLIFGSGEPQTWSVIWAIDTTENEFYVSNENENTKKLCP